MKLSADVFSKNNMSLSNSEEGVMRRSKLLLLSAFVGAAAGAGVWIVIKRKQKKARTENKHIPYGPYEAVVKRPMDILISGAALVILSPVLAVIGALVRIKLGSPIFFRQQRPGLNEKIFPLIKFRTMSDERDEGGALLPDEERLSGFGKMLRSTSLDELPELLNIVKGDMSLVGPRPLLTEYLPRYNERQAHRHDVRPGLTGLAQMLGRNRLTWDEKFEADIKYVEKITFLGDMKILFDTMKIVLNRTGINSGTSVTMEVFMGSEEE